MVAAVVFGGGTSYIVVWQVQKIIRHTGVDSEVK